MQIVAIAGLGLIGGSLGLALRQRGLVREVLGVAAAPYSETALSIGAIDRSVTFEEAAAQADLLVLSETVEGILQRLDQTAGLARPGCLITDVGSTKGVIVEHACRVLPPEATFVGGHPLAGKEQRGIASADGNLFDNRLWALTEACGPDIDAIASFADLLTGVGAIVRRMNASLHDRVVAYTSHLPQMISTALAATVQAELETTEDSPAGDSPWLEIFGPGLLDMTRLAASSPDLWWSIIDTNRIEIERALESFDRMLEFLRESLRSEIAFQRFFEQSADFSKMLRRKPG